MVRSRAYLGLTLVAVITDVVMTNLSIFLAYYLRFEAGLMPILQFHPWRAYIGLAVAQSIILPILFALQGLYRFRRNVSRIDELQKVFVTVSVGMVLTMAINAFLSRDFEYARAVLIFGWVIAIILIWLGRLLQYWVQGLVRRGRMRDRMLIVGTGEMGRAILQRIQASPNLGYQPIGFIADTANPQPVDDLPVLGSIEEIESIVECHGISEVIIADASFSHHRILDIVSKCEKGHVSIKVFPDVFQIIASGVSISDLNGLPMVSVRDAALRGWNLAIKRAVDAVLSSVLLVVLSPLMVFTALLIKLTSPEGPVFYIQERVGLDSKPFKMIKFRSMRPSAEEETGPVWARAGDPRTTRLGRLLRRLSLDELPQFINVLIGEMSVVGPRAERPHFVEQFSQRVPRYLERHKEKAGITGWAQVNGLRGNVNIDERTAYDLWYVENWTLWLDFKIMLRTVIAIFAGKNAY